MKPFTSPVKCDIKAVPEHLQLASIDLTSNENVRDNFNDFTKAGNLLLFYNALPDENFKNLKSFARNMFPVFGSTYICEQTFSNRNYVKSKYTSSLSDEHLKRLLIIGAIKFETKWATSLCKDSSKF